MVLDVHSSPPSDTAVVTDPFVYTGYASSIMAWGVCTFTGFVTLSANISIAIVDVSTCLIRLGQEVGQWECCLLEVFGVFFVKFLVFTQLADATADAVLGQSFHSLLHLVVL